MEAHEIRDGEITASEHKSGYNPYRARLNARSGWLASFNRLRKPYIQVKVNGDAKYTVTGMATQGVNQHIIYSFTLSYSLNDIDWVDYQEDGKVRVRD